MCGSSLKTEGFTRTTKILLSNCFWRNILRINKTNYKQNKTKQNKTWQIYLLEWVVQV